MTVRADHFSHGERVVYVLIAFALFIVEMRAVYRDRDEHDRQQTELRIRETEARKAEHESFESLLGEGRNLFAQGRSVLDLSKRNFDTLTGGNSFCYLAFNVGSDKEKVSVWLLQYGRNQVFDLSGRIADLELFDQSVKAGRLFEDRLLYERQFALGNVLRGTGQVVVEYPPVSAQTNKKSYNVFMLARNGAFTELVRLVRKTDKQWARAIVVTASYYDGKHGVVFDDIAKDFPKDKLKQDKDWQNAEELPRLHIKK